MKVHITASLLDPAPVGWTLMCFGRRTNNDNSKHKNNIWMQIAANCLNFNALNEIDLRCWVKHRVLESCLLPLYVTKSTVKHLKVSLNDHKEKEVPLKSQNQMRKLIYDSCILFFSILHSIQNSADYWIFFLWKFMQFQVVYLVENLWHVSLWDYL